MLNLYVLKDTVSGEYVSPIFLLKNDGLMHRVVAKSIEDRATGAIPLCDIALYRLGSIEEDVISPSSILLTTLDKFDTYLKAQGE